LATKSARPGLRYCNECKGQFTATVGTVFERSKIPLTKWWLAMHLLGSSKKGISSHQLHRMLGVSYKSTWFMMHRIREAMRTGSIAPMGGVGGTVEADETFIGRKDGSIKRANVAKETAMMTDEGGHYFTLGDHFASHESVSHKADEYVRGDVYTNTIEGYFSIFKRGMKGVYQHCGEKHLHRYLAEFDFRYNNRIALGIGDKERVETIVQGISGKRLTYRRAYKESDAAPF
jgi:ISXO2-like transposase domain